MVKPDSNGKVIAAKVYDVKPFFKALQHKIIHVLNEDDNVLTENLPVDTPAQGHFSQIPENDPRRNQIDNICTNMRNNNGQMLLNYYDNLENEKKFALYRWDHQKDSSADFQGMTLGKRPANIQDLD